MPRPSTTAISERGFRSPSPNCVEEGDAHLGTVLIFKGPFRSEHRVSGRDLAHRPQTPRGRRGTVIEVRPAIFASLAGFAVLVVVILTGFVYPGLLIPHCSRDRTVESSSGSIAFCSETVLVLTTLSAGSHGCYPAGAPINGTCGPGLTERFGKTTFALYSFMPNVGPYKYDVQSATVEELSGAEYQVWMGNPFPPSNGLNSWVSLDGSAGLLTPGWDQFTNQTDLPVVLLGFGP